ncbi:synaptophysin-like protein 1 [Gadus chalcogrammus]|uniref:synaptophysin-like protein 1 n=1 Tax=Gadus chalcogrammus TaxID=1042646 RepID=UPI0024C4C42C|nr:synaptophysin-like protein 1 [Gadus chalcogrammus]
MMTGFRLNLSPLKEPLGFVKLVEWLTAIFAFGSCGGYSGTNVISLFCGNGTNETLSAAFSYPFRLSEVSLVESNLTFCNHTAGPTHLVGDSASSAEFFVGVGVVCFLYSMVALLVYLGYMHVYKDSDFGPIIDFLLTAALAFLWLVSSSAWARGLQTVKHATGDAGIAATLGVCAQGDVTCRVTEFASLRSLNVSAVFGFLNLCVWAGNAWFVYKETRWHAQKHGGQAVPQRTQVPAAI